MHSRHGYLCRIYLRYSCITTSPSRYTRPTSMPPSLQCLVSKRGGRGKIPPACAYLTRLEQIFSLLLVHTLSTVVHGTCA